MVFFQCKILVTQTMTTHFSNGSLGRSLAILCWRKNVTWSPWGRRTSLNKYTIGNPVLYGSIPLLTSTGHYSVVVIIIMLLLLLFLLWNVIVIGFTVRAMGSMMNIVLLVLWKVWGSSMLHVDIWQYQGGANLINPSIACVYLCSQEAKTE